MPSLITGVWTIAATPGAESDALADAKTVVEILGTLVTAAAVVVGGLWAYFKFVKNRTYRPRLEVELSGQWRQAERTRYLQARVSVKNIGASKVDLLQHGTGLRVSTIALTPKGPGVTAAWLSRGVFRVFTEHSWIEPGETVVDDLLIQSFDQGPELTLFESRFVWKAPGHDSNVSVLTRRVIPTDAELPAREN